MNTKIVVAVIIILVILGLGYFLFQNMDATKKGGVSDSTEQKKAPHFVSSTPAHGESLSQAPTEVKIDFNFDLVDPSKITVTREGQEVNGVTKIAEDRLSITTSLNGTGTGDYEVSYSACWADQSCHPGSFSFSVQ